MPRKNVYIRTENEDKWEALVNKSAWVNEHLGEKPGLVGNVVEIEVDEERRQNVPIMKNTKPAVELKDWKVKPSAFGVNLCKTHGTPLTVYGKCLMKGCKYS